jgi:hypothetical protein
VRSAPRGCPEMAGILASSKAGILGPHTLLRWGCCPAGHAPGEASHQLLCICSQMARLISVQGCYTAPKGSLGSTQHSRLG